MNRPARCHVLDKSFSLSNHLSVWILVIIFCVFWTFVVFVLELFLFSKTYSDLFLSWFPRGLLLTRLVKLKSSLRRFCGRHHDLVYNRNGLYVHFYNHNPVLPYSQLIPLFVTIVTRRVPLVEQHPSSLLLFVF